MKSLENKIVAITGGSSGIGLAIAEGLVREGAWVAIAGRSSSKMEAALKLLREAGATKFLGMQVDVTKDEELKVFFDKIALDLGPIYGLIPAAGLYGSIGPFLESPIEDWGMGIQVNLLGTAKTVYYGCKKMAKTGGRIILWSGGGQGVLENFSDYVASKGGVWRLTETLGAELYKKNIFVNAIAPGAVNTGFIEDLLKAGEHRVGKEIYQKSLEQKINGAISPSKTVELCKFLLSERSAGLYGKTISAQWDDYQNWTQLENISKSDLFTFKRVVENDGGTRPKN